MEIKGKIFEIMETQEVSDRFTKREFVVETLAYTKKDGEEVMNHIILQTTQDNVSLLNGVQVGSQVSVTFNINGKRIEKNGKVYYFNNLNVSDIMVLGAKASNLKPEDDKSDLPF